MIPLILASCRSNSEKIASPEPVSQPEKLGHDGYSQLPDSLKPVFIPDTSIGEISLINTKNVIEYLGADIMDRLSDKPLNNASTITKDKKQELIVYFHSGSRQNEFSEFEILYSKKQNKQLPSVDSDEYKTESGIKLGITIGALKSIKGGPLSIDSGETQTYHYRLDDFENSDFLNKYNMPIYYSDYEFRDSNLIRFRFGFEYP